MSDYIKREDALNCKLRVTASQAHLEGMEAALSAYAEYIKALPAAPVREVVTCGECKHYKDGFCYNPNTYDDEKTRGNTTPEWFCADGERADMRGEKGETT